MIVRAAHETIGEICYVDPLTGLAIPQGSLVEELVHDPKVTRMDEVGQLGLSRERPYRNYWTRYNHCLAVGLEGSEIAKRNGFSQSDQLLALFMGIYHDPHPAGGDGLKIALGIDEAAIAEDYWFSSEAGERFIRCSSRLGWDPVEVKREIIAMIKRESNSPTAQLIHGPTKREADIDFLSYTRSDLKFGSAFQYLRKLGWSECDKEFEANPCQVINSFPTVSVLLENIISGGEFGQSDKVPAVAFAYEDFDPMEKFVWDKERQKWVMTDSELMAHYAVASASLHRSLYFHPGVQGPELMMAKAIREMGIREEVLGVALETTDERLKTFLGEYGLDYWVSGKAHDGWQFRSSDGREELAQGEYFFQLPNFNLRLETPVVDGNKVIPFSEARPEIVGFIESLFGLGGEKLVLTDTLWETRPKLDGGRSRRVIVT